MIWTYYDKRSGRVLGKHDGKQQPILRGDMGAIEGAVPNGQYIDIETLETAPLGILEPVIKGNAISGLPDGTEITRPYELLATGDVTFAVDYDETIKLVLFHPHYHPLAVTLECSADARGDVKIEQDVLQMRAKAYPDIRDQLDALWKGGKDADEMKARVLDVKAKLPKKIKPEK